MSEESKNNVPVNKTPETLLDKQQPNMTWLYCLFTGIVTGFMGYQVGKGVGKKEAEKEMQQALEKERDKNKRLKKELEQKEPTRYTLDK